MTATLQFAKQKCRESLLDICLYCAQPDERVMGLEPMISCLGSKRLGEAL